MQESEREAAAGRGDRTYQGTNCKRGHDGQRFTISGACCACVREAKAAYRERLRNRMAQADAAKAGA